MSRPDEIAALADEFDALVKNECWNVDVFGRVSKSLRLSATSPGDAVREAWQTARKYVSSHADAAGAAAAIIAIFAALAPAEKAGEVVQAQDVRWGVNVLLEIIAKKFEENDTWDIWKSDAAALVRGFKHAATPTPPSADVAKISWLLTLAAEGLEFYRQERLRCGHKFGTKKIGLYDNEVDDFQSAKAAIEGFIQSAAQGGGTKKCPNCNNANEYGDYEGPTCEKCMGHGVVGVWCNEDNRRCYLPECSEHGCMNRHGGGTEGGEG